MRIRQRAPIVINGITHGTEFDHFKGLAVFTGADLFKQHRRTEIFTNFPRNDGDNRRQKQQTKERGRNIDDILDRYLSTLKPMHKKFIAPSKEYADIVIPNNKRNDTAINIIKTIINEQCC